MVLLVFTMVLLGFTMVLLGFTMDLSMRHVPSPIHWWIAIIVPKEMTINDDLNCWAPP
jgi:hypothetical protein